MSSINSICSKSSSVTFEFIVNDVSKLTSTGIYTPTFTLQNSDWCVPVRKRVEDGKTRLAIGLKCSRKTNTYRWSKAQAIFRLLPLDKKKQHFERKYGPFDFSERDDRRTFGKFISWSELFNYVKDDKIILQCEVKAFAPQHVVFYTSMARDLVQVVNHSADYFVNPLLQIIGFCKHENELKELNLMEDNIFDGINRQLREIKQIFNGFEYSLTDDLKHDVLKFLKFFFGMIEAVGKPLSFFFGGEQRSCIQPSSRNKLILSSKEFYNVPMTHDNGMYCVCV